MLRPGSLGGQESPGQAATCEYKHEGQRDQHGGRMGQDRFRQREDRTFLHDLTILTRVTNDRLAAHGVCLLLMINEPD